MREGVPWTALGIVPVMIIAGLLVACSSGADGPDAEVEPYVKESTEGSDLSRLTLTAKAAERLGIEVAEVADNVVAYGAVLYDTDGNTFLYTNPEPLTFVRAPIVVDYIEGDRAGLASGPPAGTKVVVVGAAELVGIEFGVGK